MRYVFVFFLLSFLNRGVWGSLTAIDSLFKHYLLVLIAAMWTQVAIVNLDFDINLQQATFYVMPSRGNSADRTTFKMSAF